MAPTRRRESNPYLPSMAGVVMVVVVDSSGEHSGGPEKQPLQGLVSSQLLRRTQKLAGVLSALNQV